MATINIYVSKIANSGQLSLRLGTAIPGTPDDPDNDTLVAGVDPSDTVRWSVDQHPDPGRNNNLTLVHVKAAIPAPGPYLNSQQLLENAEYSAEYTPDPMGVITATVLATPPPAKPGEAKAFENYQIGYFQSFPPPTDPTVPETWDDPRLQMN
ncbi:hypothetical protein [uncultured Eudoraea sp.]|uniref:hypothetical protein n=1 Tax=uncultured Eudoraea sp. TaxID=1035614 RepID=UPI00263220C8|nr:hypothetical protein [uncultured Eudoraea sp.]